MVYRNLNPAPVVLTGTTDSTGIVTLTIPAGQLQRFDGFIGTVVDGTTPCTTQVTQQPTLGADLRTATAAARTVKVAVYRSNVITSLLVTLGAQGLVPAGAGVVVQGLAYGI